ncbi:uncharacterized protein N7487_010689 [Penicillium crustosum]|uniref:uncharacterized protein n=1 Tax=Penicillium crustosum TaxID=36656 RepID=UPI00238A3CF2|nr:uncharacterized protein N7487_010689 [Penicillium crustosum]KAJ5396386.1 hypothetical protein N7487_010689 [Penicillium crustosum]
MRSPAVCGNHLGPVKLPAETGYNIAATPTSVGRKSNPPAAVRLTHVRMPPERRIVMEKSKDIKRRHQRSKPFRFTPAQIARMDREDQREARAKQIREKDARRIANKKEKADAEAKARTERRARGIPDPNTRVPSSQPLLLKFFNASARRDRSPEPVESSRFVADIDLPDGAILSTDRVVLGGAADWDCFDLWTDRIDGGGPDLKPQRDLGNNLIVIGSSSDPNPARGNDPGCGAGKTLPGCDGTDVETACETGYETYRDVTIGDMEEAGESCWRSSPPVWDLDVLASHMAPSAGLGISASTEEGEITIAVQSPSQLSCSRQSPRTLHCIPPSSPVVSAQRISPDSQSPVASCQYGSSHFASSQFDPTDFLLAEATVPVQPAIRPDSTCIGGWVDDGVRRRQSVASSELFYDDTAGWMEDIFVNTHGHPFSDDRPDVYLTQLP